MLDAVVALNTSAELEAGIAGRPVFTVLANDQAADGQAQTLHFNYLLREHGGFVSYAVDLAQHRRASCRRPWPSRPPPGPSRDSCATSCARTATSRWRRCSRACWSNVREATAGGVTASGSARARRGAGRSDPRIRCRLQSRRRTSRRGSCASRRTPAASILATPETKRWRRDGVYQLAPSVRAWLESAVRPGDTIYDVGAGVGAYTVFAARASRLHRRRVRAGVRVVQEPVRQRRPQPVPADAWCRCRSPSAPARVSSSSSTRASPARISTR